MFQLGLRTNIRLFTDLESLKLSEDPLEELYDGVSTNSHDASYYFSHIASLFCVTNMHFYKSHETHFYYDMNYTFCENMLLKQGNEYDEIVRDCK